MGTVTPKLCAAVAPSVSVAVTVTVADPFATAVTLITLPDTSAVASAPSLVTAVYASSSPSGSLKCGDISTVAASPTSIVRATTDSPATGARLGTVTAKAWVAVNPSVSVTVTVTVASPLATALSTTAPSAADAATTAASLTTTA